ncbi:hypothetical protein JZO76_05075 [Enterococcus sp. MJM12]|uniref:Uncharacterized protein n=1 Tax=Candidatus Enterococcus myersii TaxID=2815322 RepID=A0ABS3H7B8_9ENTE|nr:MULTISPECIES: hypothetical protein [Enterococcus]MBO0448904.1 hypothetical protein [Enterococcus sp. MJM12]MDT2738537.1 hypothetical protein [Enterococcus canintestini]
MQFDMEINANEFKEKKLKVLANVPLKVVIRDDSGQLVEEFITKPSQMLYDLAFLTEKMVVEVHLIPGNPVEFYPVVNAL